LVGGGVGEKGELIYKLTSKSIQYTNIISSSQLKWKEMTTEVSETDRYYELYIYSVMSSPAKRVTCNTINEVKYYMELNRTSHTYCEVFLHTTTLTKRGKTQVVERQRIKIIKEGPLQGWLP
jgi:hypothetical protein